MATISATSFRVDGAANETSGLTILFMRDKAGLKPVNYKLFIYSFVGEALVVDAMKEWREADAQCPVPSKITYALFEAARLSGHLDQWF